jgi:hypothetical protein
MRRSGMVRFARSRRPGARQARRAVLDAREVRKATDPDVFDTISGTLGLTAAAHATFLKPKSESSFDVKARLRLP